METIYNITNNLDGIKTAITRKVMAKTVSKITGNSEVVNEVVGNILDISYEGIKSAVETSKNPVIAAALESYVDTLDNLMAEYVAKKRNKFVIAVEEAKDEEKTDNEDAENIDAAFDDDVADDVMKSEGGDELSDVVSDIIETAIQGTRDQMKQAVKLALKIEKDKQEEKYNDDKEDADEFDEMTPDDPEAEAAAEKEENEENPFDEQKEGEEGENSEGENEESTPFDSDSSEEGGNPFDEQPEGNQAESNEGEAKPAENAEAPKESDGEKNGNPFESIIEEVKKEEEISMESMITDKLGLNPGELSNFINIISNKMLSKDMKTVFDTYGPESAEMNAARELYKSRSIEMAQGILNSIIVYESIGVPFNNNNIKYPDLFI